MKPGQTAVIDGGTDTAKAKNTKDKMLTFIERRHPEYLKNKEHWQFLDDCYEGGRAWFTDDNIFKYVKEGEVEYEKRKARAYRFNHSREVVDLLNKYLFKQNITRNITDAPDGLKRFWDHSAKSGFDINDLVRQISLRSSIQGRVGVVIDTNSTEDVVSVQDEKDKDIKVYAYIIRTEQLLDYAFEDDGELAWVKIAEIKRDDADPINSDGGMSIRYRLWDKNSWRLYEVRMNKKVKTVHLLETRKHGLGVVPVVLADHIITDKKYECPALIDDIAYLDRAVANYLSNLDAIIQDQTFSQLAMPAQGVLPGEDGYEKMIEIGTKRIFLYNGEGDTKPFYLSPDIKQAQLILSAIDKIISEIYHTVGLAGERTKSDNSMGIDNSSGVAKAFDFEKVNALLSAKAHSLENAENRIAKVVCKWLGQELKSDLVAYPNDFDTRGLYDEFDIAGRLALVGAPDTVRQEQMSSLLGKLFPQLDKVKKKAMENELKKWPLRDELDVTSPEAVQKPTNQGAKGPDE